MNWAHLQTFLWLRWRLTLNQFKRSGDAGIILSGILAVAIAVAAAGTLIAGVLVGLMALRTAPATAVMVAWDVAIALFAFFWLAGLMAELQRADAISLDRFLHLPVSPTSAFAINFALSSTSVALILVLPAMIGLATGLVFSRGAGMLVLFPLAAAFLLMMSALAYQFRGWLASLMQNQRRRRLVMAVVPFVFIMVTQLPNLWNTIGPGAQQRREATAERRRVIAELDKEIAAGRISREEYRKRRPVPAPSADPDFATLRLVNAIAPPGWLAYGAESAANGRVWPAFAGVLGMTLIGALSLRRAYGTTLRLYKGDFDRGQQRRPPRTAPASGAARLWVDAQLPWTSDRVSAIAMAALRAWSRAPEMKMALLTPVFMLAVFSRMFAGGGGAPDLMRPLRALTLAGMVLILGMVGPVANQFAYDRAGFRTFVLGPVPRRDVLLGKNLAALPVSLVLMGAMIGVSQWLLPMRMDHVIGVLLQLVAMHLVFCLAGNLWSIVSPVALKPASGMPVPYQGVRNFAHVLFLPLASLALGVTLVPLAIEALFLYMNWFGGAPVYLVLSALQTFTLALLYPLALNWQGALLQRREQRILEIVGAKSE